MQTTFFATDVDLLQIVRWFLDVPGMTLFEPASRPNQPIRQFCTVDEVAESFGKAGQHIAAWLECTGARPFSRHIEASGRTELRSPSVISISRYNDQNGALGASRISCWNEDGAKQRSFYSETLLSQVDWKALRSIMARSKRMISNASPAKFGSNPIMGNAFAEMCEKRLPIWGWGKAYSYPSPDIRLI